MTRLPALAAIALAAAGIASAGAPQTGVPALGPLAAIEAQDPAKVELGRYLFFDVRLSGDGSLSCASCHRPDKAWADGQELSIAYPGSKYFRNTPSVMNTAHKRYLYWDGRLTGKDLDTQARDAITETHFMNLDGRLMLERLKQVPEYVQMFQAAFKAEPNFGRTLAALAAFERTLVSRNVPFDRGELSPAAKRGLALFTGKAGCVRCHDGPMLSDFLPHRTGAPEHPEIHTDPERAHTFRSMLKFMGVPNFENLREDPGFYTVSKLPADRGKFVTPTLREVGRTAPYMHGGTFETLAEVVDFYAKGGGTGSELAPLALASRDKADLVAFLESLSGDEVTVAAPDMPEYQPIAGWREAGASLAVSHAPAVARSGAAMERQLRPLAALPAPPVPADNPQTPEKVELGKLLFFDPRLGGDASISCAECHSPSMGWTDGTDICRGYPGTSHWRNCQTVINSAYFDKLFWEGSSTSLEDQAKGAAQGGVAGNGEDDVMEERLRQVPDYVARFRQVFGTERPEVHDAWRAIAAYERTLVQRDTPFDRYMGGDKGAMPAEAVLGLRLFEGKAGCVRCHDGPLLTDQRYHNLGVPENPVFDDDALKQITYRYEQYIKGVPEAVYRKVKTDLGLYYVAKQEADMGKFRTPTLRYLSHTAPYMHNGVFWTLEEVVAFYDGGGGDDQVEKAFGHRTKTGLLAPLHLTDAEKTQLVAFLKALSGEAIVVDAPELPPYGVDTGSGLDVAEVR